MSVGTDMDKRSVVNKPLAFYVCIVQLITNIYKLLITQIYRLIDGGFFFACEYLREDLTIHSPPALFVVV